MNKYRASGQALPGPSPLRVFDLGRLLRHLPGTAWFIMSLFDAAVAATKGPDGLTYWDNAAYACLR